MLTDELEDVYVIDGEDQEEVERQLHKCQDEMVKMKAAAHLTGATVTIQNNDGAAGDNPVVPPVANHLKYDYAVVINGHSLVSGCCFIGWKCCRNGFFVEKR